MLLEVRRFQTYFRLKPFENTFKCEGKSFVFTKTKINTWKHITKFQEKRFKHSL